MSDSKIPPSWLAATASRATSPSPDSAPADSTTPMGSISADQLELVPLDDHSDASEGDGSLDIETEVSELKDGLNRCPQCGGSDIRHRVGTDLLSCHFCRHQWQGTRVEEKFGLGEGISELRGTKISSGARDIDPASSTLMSFKCSGCGAEVTVNTESTMTARCHWCRHVFGVNEQVANGAVPDAVLPFKINKSIAVMRIRSFVDKRRLFALRAFKEQFTPENVVGVYLPYMVVDANVSAGVSGIAEITERKYTVGSGSSSRTCYDADVYQVQREVDFVVDDLPLESSITRGNLNVRANTNNIINTILPFDTKNALQWNASYLNGFTSEKRDLDVEQLHPRLEDQLLSIARAQVHDSVTEYDRGVRWEREWLQVHGTRWVSMYLPVWLYSYHQPGRNGGMLHYIAVNGRTGETMGSVPVQKWKLVLATLAAGSVIEAIVLWLIMASA